MSIPTVMIDLMVAFRLALRHLIRKLNGSKQAEPNLEVFQQNFNQLLSHAGSDQVAHHYWIDLDGATPPWHNTGIHLNQGQQLSFFIEGRVYANRALDIWLAPALQLWCKLGDTAPIFRGTRKSHSFTANTKAELQLGNYFPNDWKTPAGERLHDDAVYSSNSGSIRMLLIRWQGDAHEGLQSLLKQGDVEGRISAEIERIDKPITPPQGWHYLWNLGPSEIYQAGTTDQGKACIHCHTHQDVGILQYSVDIPFDQSCQLDWRWLLQQLPATLREDSVPSHDYLSIAVEFDNGRDLSYYWSESLPVATGFDCPLPNWAGKEYHVVVRSGQAGLNQWQQQSRNIYQDYQRYMGEPPGRIVAVWLIANSVFLRGHGIVDFEAINIQHQGQQTTVL